MRVYAESNFVLEIVLTQEQHAACKDFVTLADRHEVELVLPAFSLFEPYTTLERRRQERHKLREQLELEFPDAIVLASVLDDLGVSPSPSCFLNRNTKDFDDPGVRDALAARDCRVFGSFDNGLQYVRSQLPAASPGA